MTNYNGECALDKEIGSRQRANESFVTNFEKNEYIASAKVGCFENQVTDLHFLVV